MQSAKVLFGSRVAKAEEERTPSQVTHTDRQREVVVAVVFVQWSVVTHAQTGATHTKGVPSPIHPSSLRIRRHSRLAPQIVPPLAQGDATTARRSGPSPYLSEPINKNPILPEDGPANAAQREQKRSIMK